MRGPGLSIGTSSSWGMSGTGAGIQNRLELLMNPADEATGVILIL